MNTPAHRMTSMVGIVASISILAGCAAPGSPVPVGPTSSTPPASFAAKSPAPTASLAATPSAPAASWDSFVILPADQPADFVSGIICDEKIGATDPVALVTTPSGDSETTVLMDYADPGEPRPACTVAGDGIVSIIDAQHLVVAHFNQDAMKTLFAIVDLPAVRYHWFNIPAGSFGNTLLAIAPDLSEIAWNQVEDNDVPFDQIHLTTAAGDRVVAKLPDTNHGRCGAPTDSNPAAYTRRGSALFVFDAPLPEISLVVVKDGRLVLSMPGTAKAATSTRPQRVLWSPVSETLSWTQAGNVWQWTQTSGSRIFLKGVTWDNAAISPDGTHLAYDVIGANGLHDTYLVDLAGGGSPVRIGGGHRGNPTFLDDRQLYYIVNGQTLGCGYPEPTSTFIYDLTTGIEMTSSFVHVVAWPGTSTSY